MRIILLIFISTITLGCTSDDGPTGISHSRYYLAYMHYSQDVWLWPSDASLVTIKYDGSKIVKRTGGLRGTDPATGTGGKYSSEISDTVIYTGKKILIEEGIILPFYPNPSSRTEFLLDNNHRVIQRVNLQESLNLQTRMDTTKYYYNSFGLLYQSKRGKETLDHEIATYYYNASQNLDSIVTIEYLYNDILFYKTKETFSQYDTAFNPLKNLFIFKETFLRTLSRNNYMHYERNKYDYDNILVEHEVRNWSIPHDASGNIYFDRN